MLNPSSVFLVLFCDEAVLPPQSSVQTLLGGVGGVFTSRVQSGCSNVKVVRQCSRFLPNSLWRHWVFACRRGYDCPPPSLPPPRVHFLCAADVGCLAQPLVLWCLCCVFCFVTASSQQHRQPNSVNNIEKTQR